jgi:hypothetical protein
VREFLSTYRELNAGFGPLCCPAAPLLRGNVPPPASDRCRNLPGSRKCGPVFLPQGTGSTTAVTGPPPSGLNSAQGGNGMPCISAALTRLPKVTASSRVWYRDEGGEISPARLWHADAAAGYMKVGSQQPAGVDTGGGRL